MTHLDINGPWAFGGSSGWSETVFWIDEQGEPRSYTYGAINPERCYTPAEGQPWWRSPDAWEETETGGFGFSRPLSQIAPISTGAG